MIITNEIASITVLVPYRSGSEMSSQIVPFKVFKEQNTFKAIPLISKEERELTNLPQELLFDFVNYSIVQGTQTAGTLAVMNNIVQELRMQRVL